jgi:hypothetical protein
LRHGRRFPTTTNGNSDFDEQTQFLLVVAVKSTGSKFLKAQGLAARSSMITRPGGLGVIQNRQDAKKPPGHASAAGFIIKAYKI